MATQAFRIPPSSQAEQKQIATIHRMLLLDGTAVLVGPDNTRVNLPSPLYDVLVKVVSTLEYGKGLSIIPQMEQLSTQTAANMLGVCRQFFVKEIEAGKVPCHYVGSHRRVYLKDVLDYGKERQSKRRASIRRMAQEANDAGLYDKFVPIDED